MSIYQQHNEEIARLCRLYRVNKLYSFGAVVKPRDTESGELDMMVDFHPSETRKAADGYFGLKTALEGLFKRSIELLEQTSIRNKYFNQVADRQRTLVFTS